MACVEHSYIESAIIWQFATIHSMFSRIDLWPFWLRKIEGKNQRRTVWWPRGQQPSVCPRVGGTNNYSVQYTRSTYCRIFYRKTHTTVKNRARCAVCMTSLANIYCYRGLPKENVKMNRAEETHTHIKRTHQFDTSTDPSNMYCCLLRTFKARLQHRSIRSAWRRFVRQGVCVCSMVIPLRTVAVVGGVSVIKLFTRLTTDASIFTASVAKLQLYI